MKENHFIKFLKKHRKESYFLVSAPGNSGDILLKKGLELYLKNNKYKIVNKIETAENILIHGGGNIDDVWHSGIEIFQSMSKKYPDKKIIVAPHTCLFFKTNFEKILNDCKQEIHFFTREKNSYERLKKLKLNKNINVYLADDTAFLLEDTSYLEALKKQNGNNHILFSFRTDRESRLLKFEHRFWENSLKEKIKEKIILLTIKKFIKKNHGNIYKNNNSIITDVSYKDYDTFVDLISNALEIYTDRLHVGILGAILGKRVYLYKTKYDKIQGVFNQTLSEYPNVTKMF